MHHEPSRRRRLRSTAPAAALAWPAPAAPEAALPGTPAPHGAAPRAAPLPAPQAAAQDAPTSAPRAHLPNARHRRRSAPAGGPRGWQSTSTDRATPQTTCRTPTPQRTLPTTTVAPRQPDRPATHRARNLPRAPTAVQIAGEQRRTRTRPRAPSRVHAEPRADAQRRVDMPPRAGTSSRHRPRPRPSEPRPRARAAPLPLPARARAQASSPQHHCKPHGPPTGHQGLLEPDAGRDRVLRGADLRTPRSVKKRSPWTRSACRDRSPPSCRSRRRSGSGGPGAASGEGVRPALGHRTAAEGASRRLRRGLGRPELVDGQIRLRGVRPSIRLRARSWSFAKLKRS